MVCKVNLPTINKPELPANYIVVRFGSAYDPVLQGRILLHLERWLREQGVPAEVFKETMPDDSKLRRSITPEQRSKL